MSAKKRVIIGILGSVLDAGFHSERWAKWRPTISLCRHADLPVDRVELLYDPAIEDLARCVSADVGRCSPATSVRRTPHAPRDPWDFAEVYAALHEFARNYPFQPHAEEYLVHITTGTHVQQICLFLLTESRHLPARLLQSSPMSGPGGRKSPEGRYTIIDLDLSQYDQLAARFGTEQREAQSFLKSGIATRNARFNELIERIEHVAIHAREPLLLSGPTGAGKSQLAQRIYELKKRRHQLSGAFVAVNCATLCGDGALSALFGHVKGAFTGAAKDRPGLLRAADGGLLFLDEIGELGLDEQALLLRALEDKRFLPFGGDAEVASDFQLIAGTNRDLPAAVRAGRFREDLLARINLWSFALPGLRERPEDIEPNLDYELEQFARRRNLRLSLPAEVRAEFVHFATAPAARWTANFRDLNACVIRLGTLAPGGRVTAALLRAEIERLQAGWAEPAPPATPSVPATLPAVADAPARAPGLPAELDLFDQAQLACVLRVCRESSSLSAAGRRLFAATRTRRKTPNDADRLRKYLARFGLDWERCRQPTAAPG